MERELLTELNAWRTTEPHFPLLLRGARQVGKTYLVRQFAQKYFENFVEINFEKHAKFQACFESLDPINIVNAISLMKQQDIISGKTLLFFDEIQACPRAIMALRYFKEEIPELHVIGAGSLLEFAINNDDISIPVGRVQYIYLKPLSFREYLTVSNQGRYIEFLSQVTVNSKIPNVIHQELLKLVREYMVLGGMPMVIDSYLRNKQFRECQRYQTLILDTYRDDFGKYATKTNHKYLERVFERTPGLVGQTIKYSTIDHEMRSRDLKSAIKNLNHAGVISPVYATNASGLPLETFINEKKFKLLFLDVGLVKRISKLDIEVLLSKDLLLLNRGALAEQLVGQELLAYQDPYEKARIYFWIREKKRSEAEVDFILNFGSTIIPIEVKSGKTGRLKSLQLFIEEKQSPIGVRISEQPLSLNHKILSVPFYLISELERLVKQAVPDQHT